MPLQRHGISFRPIQTKVSVKTLPKNRVRLFTHELYDFLFGTGKQSACCQSSGEPGSASRGSSNAVHLDERVCVSFLPDYVQSKQCIKKQVFVSRGSLEDVQR
jgi:hypothetical protein